MTRKARLITGVFAGLLILTLAAALYLLIPRRASYTLHGTEIITTTASGEQVGSLLHQTAWAVGDVNDLGNGRRHFPLFSQTGRSWKNEAGEDIGFRGLTEFSDRNGHHCAIETVSIPGRPTILLLKSDDAKATMDLANESVRQFQRLKVRHKEQSGDHLAVSLSSW